MTNVIFYTRLANHSQDQDQAKSQHAKQEEKCRHNFWFADGCELEKVFRDNSSGMTHPMERIGFRKMIEYLENYDGDVMPTLVVADLNRISRNVRHLQEIIEYLSDIGVTVTVGESDMFVIAESV